jgi:hypothetical protein
LSHLPAVTDTSEPQELRPETSVETRVENVSVPLLISGTSSLQTLLKSKEEKTTSRSEGIFERVQMFASNRFDGPAALASAMNAR